MYGFYCLTDENLPHPIIVAFDTSRDEFLEIEVRNEEGVISFEEKRAMTVKALLDSPEKLEEYNADEKLVNSFVSTCRSEDKEDMLERFLGLPSFQLLSVKDWNLGREKEIYPISLAISPMDRFFDVSITPTKIKAHEAILYGGFKDVTLPDDVSDKIVIPLANTNTNSAIRVMLPADSDEPEIMDAWVLGGIALHLIDWDTRRDLIWAVFIDTALSFHNYLHSCYTNSDEDTIKLHIKGDLILSIPFGAMDPYLLTNPSSQFMCRVLSSAKVIKGGGVTMVEYGIGLHDWEMGGDVYVGTLLCTTSPDEPKIELDSVIGVSGHISSQLAKGDPFELTHARLDPSVQINRISHNFENCDSLPSR